MDKIFQITVAPDESYQYDITAADWTLELSYTEGQKEMGNITFGSLEEMEEVAKAMLTAVKMRREME